MAWRVSEKAPEISAAVARLKASRAELGELEERDLHGRLISEFLARESFVIERVRKEKRQKIDARRYTFDLKHDAQRGCLIMVTEVSPNGGVKPVEVLAAIYCLTDEEKLALSSRVRRLRLYAEGLISNLPTVARPAAARLQAQ